jgi:radical SAM superfamily enzyme YgiQ (UPF0313 family)
MGAFTDDLSGDTSIDKTYLKKQFVSPPLGLHRISQHFAGTFQVDVLDPNIDRAHEFLDQHADEYQAIGSSLTHPTLENDFSLLWYARQKNPSAILMAGGEEAYFNHEQVFEYSPADLVIQGEGEMPLGGLCRLLADGGTDRSELLPNLATHPGMFVRLPGGVVQGPLNAALTPERFVRATTGMNFDQIPYQKYWDYMEAFFAEDNEATWKRTRTVRFFVSNHCPLKCTFCSSTNFLVADSGAPARVAWVDAQGLMTMITNVYRAHPELRTVFFHDDHFTLGKEGRERAIELSELVLEAKAAGKLPEHLGFMAQCKITDVTAEMLHIMSRAGFWMMSYGIESFSQNILDEFNKNCTVAEIEQGLEDNFAVDISPFANIILTSPRCTLEDVWVTVKRCVQLVAQGAEVGMNPYCMAFPGANILRDSGVAELVSEKAVVVEGTDIRFKKTDKIIPADERVQQLLELMEQGVDRQYDGNKVTSARRSNIILYALLEAFESMGVHAEEADTYQALVGPRTKAIAAGIDQEV